MEIINWIKITLLSAGAFFLLVVMMRLTGKTGFGQLAPYDLTLVLIVAGAIATPLVDLNIPFLYAVIVAGTAIVMEFLFSRLSLIDKIRPLIENEPTVIVLDGKILLENMRSTRFDMEQLMSALRFHGVRSLDEVELGTLEPNGRFSVIKKPASKKQFQNENLQDEKSTFASLKQNTIKKLNSGKSK